MKRLFAIGFVITLLLLNVGIAAAAGPAPNNSGAVTSAPTITENITQAIQTLVTSIITPIPTPVPSLPAPAQAAASPAAPAPDGAIAATAGVVPAVNPEIEQAFVDHKVMRMHNITNAQRLAAADAAAASGLTVSNGDVQSPSYSVQALLPAPGGTPDYFGPYSNYALSQLPVVNALGNVTPGTGIRKFVDTLPGLGPSGANNLGQYIPIAVPDTISYPLNGPAPASDYYEIATLEWTEKMHSDIPPTTIRGYVQLETPVMNVVNGSKHIPLTYLNGNPIRDNVTGLQVFGYDNPHFLGPLIIAQKDRPVRIKFRNYLPIGGKLSIPVDTNLMGSGLGPLGAAGGMYSEQRATVHLHGGNTPWISDGTQHQWTVPAGENTSYPTGVSVGYVPDMDNGTEPVGTLTFYYTNQQSARLMFYHEHAMGITRLGVMAGQAAGYIVQDPAEAALVAMGAIPTTQIPLIIQDRTFIPSAAQMAAQDPTWNSGGNLTSPWPHTGDFYFPHIYMPAQNPKDPNWVNAMGRWDYGPWTWPPLSSALNGPVANPYASPAAPWEPPQMPGVPTISQVPETFLDTPIINGAAYPKLTLGPHAYRFRILNAANERFFNLQLYYAGSNVTMWNPNGTLANGSAGEVLMVPAVPTPGFPVSWPIDGRAGGVPAPNASGPSWIQIGTEGGFLPKPVVIAPQPVDWDPQHRSISVTTVLNRSLLIGPAERADVIVDFTGIPDGTKLILYNDAPAPFPGPDTRYDFYTGDPNQTLIGGAPTTQAGYGPNTRTLMQIEIRSSVPQVGPNFNLATLNAQLPGAYAKVQDKPLVPQAAYNTAFKAAYTNQYLSIPSTTMTFTPAGQAAPITMNLMPKSIMEGFDPDYGRITANFGVEVLPVPGLVQQQGIGYFNNDPETEIFANTVPGTLIGTQADGTQIWKVTHNGVDTHILHVHMYNLQIINRVFWDGTVAPPADNELGWKESVQINPLQDLVVAMRPIAPTIPWELPNSIRPLNAITPIGSAAPGEFTGLDPQGTQINVVNHVVNFGWEYLWHCHLLGHEENDMMRSQSVAVAPRFAPANLAAVRIASNTSSMVNLTWIDTTISETDWTIQRAAAATGPWTDIARIPSTTGPQKNGTVQYSDATIVATNPYVYRVLATNVVGDTTVYPGSIGYPVVAVNSTPSNAASATGGSVVKFTTVPSSGIAPLVVRFIDQSTIVSINRWNWSFGDGAWFNTTNAALRNPTYTYTAPGTYVPTLIVCNATSCYSGSGTVTVTTLATPVVSFTKNQTTGRAPLAVSFIDRSTGTGLNQWQWNFGDGTWFNTTVAAQKSPVHTYTAPGVFTVQLTVCNAAGCSTTTPGQTITVTTLAAPVAVFTKNVTTGFAPLAVSFVERSTGTGLNQWQWNFGDGTWFNTTVAAQKSPVHTYTAPGVYNAQLTTCNAAGCNTTIPQTITANLRSPPIVVFVSNRTSGTAPLAVKFTDVSQGIPTEWRWGFGDGTWFNTTVTAQKSPVHIYTTKGVYSSQLIACNAAGCNVTAPSRTINVL